MTATVLVVEDNPVNMELVVYLLEARGHTVLTATDGREGLAELQRKIPDIIICDLEMPTMNGFEFLEALRDDPAFGQLPVVAVTASSMPGDRTRVLQAGFDAYLSKPIRPQTFVDVIEDCLRAHGSARG
jgi:CheY-like chemotaxis protein